MSEPPRKKLKQTSILDLFGRRKVKSEPSDIIIKVVSEEDADRSQNSQSSDVIVISDTSSQEMSDGYDERRAKTAMAAEMRRKENVSSASRKGSDANRSTDGKPKPVLAFQEDVQSQGLSHQMASTTLEYSPDITADSESPLHSEASVNIEEFPESPLQDLEEAKGATSKIPRVKHARDFDIPDDKPSPSTVHSKGTPIEQLKRSPACSPKYPPQALKTSLRHAVLIKTPVIPGVIPKPSYSSYTDEWSGSFVRMPCSPENLYPVDGANGRKELRARWELIEAALLKLVSGSTNVRDLEKAILSYNSRHENKWDFSDLRSFFVEYLEVVEKEEFFKNTLPAMVELALQLPYLCTQPIPLLKVNEEHAVTFSQQQVACLLANAFFCTFPRRNAKHRNSEYSSFPTINFNELYQGSSRMGASARKAGKLKCLINYFRRVTKSMPTGTVTFYRQVEKYTDFPLWAKSDCKLCKLHITAYGTIEDQGEGMLQVDFANKFLGGGVLRTGCVQEEIRFMICPEMILSRLITECLDPNECLIMTGCEQFSTYDGYANSFEWTGDHEDTILRDSWGRRYTQVVALDATAFRSKSSEQFGPDSVRRELNKAYCGFLDRQTAVSQMQAVATGNWGCGAFGGNVYLKLLIQLMAASEVRRDICYFTFGDVELVDAAYSMYEFLVEKDVSVGTLWRLLNQYYVDICYSGASVLPRLNLFDYIYKVYNDYEVSTDEGSSPATHEGRDPWDDVVFDGETSDKEEMNLSSQGGT